MLVRNWGSIQALNMKNAILISFLGILLIGNATPDLLLISHKYDKYIMEEVIINVNNHPCSWFDNVKRNGCTVFENDIPTKIEISPLSDDFERTMLHESYHYIFNSHNEEKAMSFAVEFRDWVNKQK